MAGERPTVLTSIPFGDYFEKRLFRTVQYNTPTTRLTLLLKDPNEADGRCHSSHVDVMTHHE